MVHHHHHAPIHVSGTVDEILSFFNGFVEKWCVDIVVSYVPWKKYQLHNISWCRWLEWRKEVTPYPAFKHMLHDTMRLINENVIFDCPYHKNILLHYFCQIGWPQSQDMHQHIMQNSVIYIQSTNCLHILTMHLWFDHGGHPWHFKCVMLNQSSCLILIFFSYLPHYRDSHFQWPLGLNKKLGIDKSTKTTKPWKRWWWK